MAMTNAERQRRYRAQQKQAGLVRKDAWTDKAGLLAPASETGAWQTMKLKELDRELQKLFSFEGWKREAVYAELFAYAQHIEKRLKSALNAGDIE